MAKRRRTRHKKVTYDSSESKVVFGIISLLLAILALLSNSTEGTIFEYIKQIFGQSTFFVFMFFLVLSAKFFRIKPDKITYKTVFGFFLVTIAVATYLTGITGSDKTLKSVAYSGEYGGIIGYNIAEYIGDALFRDAIRPMMLVVIFLSVPLIISMSITDYFKAIKNFFVWIANSVKKGVPERSELSTLEEERDEKQATMVGDFMKEKIEMKPKGNEKKTEAQKEYEAKLNENSDFTGVADGQELPREEKVRVNIRESQEKKNLLMQEELQYPGWQTPPIHLLSPYKKSKPSSADVKKNTKVIEQTLASFGIKAQVVDVVIGPSVTQYALNIALGTKVSKIANLRNDLALALATSANAVRIEAPIQGTSFVGIEVPNSEREMVGFRELAEDPHLSEKQLNVTLGKDITGNNIFFDIQKMPHLLIAGATGSGKSVVTNSFIMSLLMQKSPDQVRFIMVDPKQVELSDYNGIPHLLTPVITDMEKVNNALKWAINEMESRYTEFKDNKVRNIEAYNEKMEYIAMPYIVVVIDEMADMMMTQHGAEIENSIVRLAQKARATGIHLILATQRPSVDVITGLIKANIPGRIGLSVTTQVDSRVILDQIGAESLLGRGDMLFRDPGQNRMARIQGTFVSQEEVNRVVNFIKEQSPDVEYTSQITKTQPDPNAPEGSGESSAFSEDDLFASAARIVVNAGKGSSSLIQRKLSIGYNRAARLLDELHEQGIVGPARGSKPRDILVHDIETYLSQGPNKEDFEDEFSG